MYPHSSNMSHQSLSLAIFVIILISSLPSTLQLLCSSIHLYFLASCSRISVFPPKVFYSFLSFLILLMSSQVLFRGRIHVYIILERHVSTYAL